MIIHTRPLRAQDIDPIAAAFAALGWNKPAAQYARYLGEQKAGQRHVIVAVAGAQSAALAFAGYLTVRWESEYPPFRAESIPEIQDFNVLPRFRRRGIGSRLMDEAEDLVARRSRVCGIGVGLTADYGAAQRIYARRGYVPDGKGVYWRGGWVQPGQPVIVDDDLVLYMTKAL